MAVPIVTGVPRQARRMRRPQHTFHVRQRAWQIQPIMIAPVLPGETMRQLLLQCRAVADPIRNPLIGWWLEYFFFYVKHRDLEGRDDFTQMMLDPNHSLSAYVASSEAAGYYAYDGGINWTKLCLQRVVEEYFRDEGEAWDVAMVDGLPLCQLNRDSWLQNITLDSDMAQFDVEIADTDLDDSEANFTASQIDEAMRQWHLLRQHGVTEMSYEDYLRSFGIRVPEAEEPHRPELIRYIRDWTYPVNTVEPSTGIPSSALSWSIAERADKDRFFKEPGFILGVSVVRPKVYLSAQKGAAVGMLDNAYSWLPAILRSNPNYSFKRFDEGDGPLVGLELANDSGYWVDLTDLFMHGDQFVNFDFPDPSTGTNYHLNNLALPAADAGDMTAIRARYPTEAMCEQLFVDHDDSDGKTRIGMDGVVSLHIASSLRDMTP